MKERGEKSVAAPDGLLLIHICKIFDANVALHQEFSEYVCDRGPANNINDVMSRLIEMARATHRDRLLGFRRSLPFAQSGPLMNMLRKHLISTDAFTTTCGTSSTLASSVALTHSCTCPPSLALRCQR